MKTQFLNHTTNMMSSEIRNFPSMGLGDLFLAITKRFGLSTCSACQRHGMALNRWFPNVLPKAFRSSMASRTNCRTYTGRCTGFGTRQCVIAPVSFDPDAATIEHCCNGWFQYPWIEICEGEPPKMGCGFCFW